jgi:hypothetical protein
MALSLDIFAAGTLTLYGSVLLKRFLKPLN